MVNNAPSPASESTRRRRRPRATSVRTPSTTSAARRSTSVGCCGPTCPCRPASASPRAAYRRVVGDRLDELDRRSDGTKATLGSPPKPGEIVLAAPVPDDLAAEPSRRATAPSVTTCRWRCARRPPPRTCPARASRASRTPTSTSSAPTPCSTPYAAAGPRCGPSVPSATAPPRASTTHGVALAVVVQRMVDAEVAGVMFTAEPGHRQPPPAR